MACYNYATIWTNDSLDYWGIYASLPLKDNVYYKYPSLWPTYRLQ